MKKLLLPGCGILFLCLSLCSLQAQEISSVVFQQNSDYKFEDDVLRANVQSRKGAAYSERSVNDDIKRLHAMGMFADVLSETQKTEDGKIRIIFKLTAKPIVTDIVFEGNKKYPAEKLREQISMVSTIPLND